MPGEKPKKSSDEPKQEPARDQPEPRKGISPEEMSRKTDETRQAIENGLTSGKIIIPKDDEPDIGR